ncbi:phytanoyl-CoA dioxygenase family protein [Parashewanella tropica]|uniref:phytanoyl-CoA dioxygenase family protein n=1 Tax=Parashewanella tropica TaxID=2547970 RepID=UPI00105A098A|nr:phytanoyl-CoA dioxygenase family protein [Parashewanella tropica]
MSFKLFSDLSKPDEIKRSFDEHGFAVFENFYAAEECEGLIERMRYLVETEDTTNLGTFFTIYDDEHHDNTLLLDSGDKISFFLEKTATAEDISTKQGIFENLNKVGHALHDIDPVFDKFSRKPELERLVGILGNPNPLLLQSMFIFKSAKVGGEVVPHQDGAFQYTEPESVIGFWVALQDANLSNGCLLVKDGGHKGPLRHRYFEKDSKLESELLDETPFPELSLPLEVKQGSLIAFHGRLPHGSCANISDKSRYAYALHIINGDCHYPEDSWLKRSDKLPLRGF